MASILIAGCGSQSNQSSTTAPQASTDNPAPAAAPPPEPTTAPAQQGASVSELLASNAPNASVNAGNAPTPPPPNSPDNAGADNPAGGGDVEYARVVGVQKIPGSQQVCTDQTVVEKRKPEDKNRVAGTVIGAIAGGVIGNQFGGGRGRSVATVGGAVAGGAIGRKVQGDHQDKDTVTRVVRHCRPVTREEAGADLYDVTYAYQGQNFHVRLDHDPGDRIELPVRGVE